MQLYPEVLRLGPCGDAVQEFFDAAAAVGGLGSLHLVFADMWVEMVKVYKDDLFLSRGTTKDNFLYDVLRESVKERFAASHGYGVVECITVVSLGRAARKGGKMFGRVGLVRGSGFLRLSSFIRRVKKTKLGSLSLRGLGLRFC